MKIDIFRLVSMILIFGLIALAVVVTIFGDAEGACSPGEPCYPTPAPYPPPQPGATPDAYPAPLNPDSDIEPLIYIPHVDIDGDGIPPEPPPEPSPTP